MKITVGDKLEEITLPDKDGNSFSLSQTLGKKVLLTFYRIAGCSFCNLRLNEINKRFGELGDNFTHVGIFHSPVDNLKSYMDKHKNLPFTVLADENFENFQKYEIERSVSKTINAIFFKAHKIIPAMLKVYIPTKIKGHLYIAVTDVLINEDGVVEDVYYAQKDIADHFEFAKIKQFALN